MIDNSDPKHLVRTAKSEYQRQNYLNSARTFHKARMAYEANNNRIAAGEMANNSSVAYLQANQPDQALAELDGVEDYFSDYENALYIGISSGNRAAALEALNRVDEAMHEYRNSADNLKKAGNDQLRASVLQSLSSLQFRTGKQLQALVSMKHGIDGLKKPTAAQRMLKHMLNIPFEMMTKNS